jgi:hypothetical protein
MSDYARNNKHNFQLRQLIALAAQGSLNTPWVAPFATSGATGDANRAIFLVWVGTLGGAVTLNAKLTQAKNSDGGDAKDITEAVFPVFNTTDDERIRSIEITPGVLDDPNGYRFVRVEVTVAGGTGVYGVLQYNHELRYPGAENQHETYDSQLIVLGRP